MKWFDKWLDKKVDDYQQQAFDTFARMQDVPPERRQQMLADVMQGARAHIDPAAAAALSNQETADFLMQSREEQLRQQQEMQAAGQQLRVLWENGRDVEVTIVSLAPTGVVLGGQRQYVIEVQVEDSGRPYSTTATQLIPVPAFSSYAVGARFHGKVDSQDRTVVGIFQPLG